MLEDLFAKKEIAREAIKAEAKNIKMNERLKTLHVELEQLASGRTEDNIPVTERAYWDKRNEILTFEA